ncbi:rhodanese-like domain-containing protein [Maribacter sp. PR1]|uniref:Rhodanese-like domain-containing protein n=1 Tax=Maribacter cobaltidurans TaxID=1178778 RepID=A0ABU7IUE5_9FLAO|nr:MULTISPECIES: rhodanese-like domain-containing protein [Maribacter]MDC6389190.1 rhodanese-like domain-containing protein [Maribacter sp. PR1]MEE1976577.1 rhodanese-like domain-containing protein [Maribacter cobaltidurans]
MKSFTAKNTTFVLMSQHVLSYIYLSLFFLFLQNTVIAQRTIDHTLKILNKESVPYIQPDSLKSNDNQILLDAREIEEFQVSHLQNAIWVGNKEFNPEKVLETVEDKNQPIVVYCSIGVRSEDIGEKLLELGYTNVQNLYGGIFEWKNKDGSVYNLQGIETDSVHAYNKLWGRLLKKGIKVYEP